jgi:hypothetical protein
MAMDDQRFKIIQPSERSIKNWEEVVVGAGPGGAAAAKGCAEAGFQTLLLEKRALPREKVCSGMIMGPWATGILRDRFGPIPPEVLTTPPVAPGAPLSRARRLARRPGMAYATGLEKGPGFLAGPKARTPPQGAQPLARELKGVYKKTLTLE